jgi:hypothetical protein
MELNLSREGDVGDEYEQEREDDATMMRLRADLAVMGQGSSPCCTRHLVSACC